MNISLFAIIIVIWCSDVFSWYTKDQPYYRNQGYNMVNASKKLKISCRTEEIVSVAVILPTQGNESKVIGRYYCLGMKCSSTVERVILPDRICDLNREFTEPCDPIRINGILDLIGSFVSACYTSDVLIEIEPEYESRIEIARKLGGIESQDF